MTMRLALTGDSILERRLNSRTDPELLPLFDLIRAADIGFTNLEVLPNDFRGHPAQESGGAHFCAPPRGIDELRDARFPPFPPPPNHTPHHRGARLETAQRKPRRRGGRHPRIGRTLEEARRPAYLPHPAGTVALLSCCSTFAKGQEASAQRPDMPGRPGLGPLRIETVHEVG